MNLNVISRLSSTAFVQRIFFRGGYSDSVYSGTGYTGHAQNMSFPGTQFSMSGQHRQWSRGSIVSKGDSSKSWPSGRSPKHHRGDDDDEDDAASIMQGFEHRYQLLRLVLSIGFT